MNLLGTKSLFIELSFSFYWVKKEEEEEEGPVTKLTQSSSYH